MRTLFKNSTAIAACLALLAPQMATAQAAADADATVVPPATQAAPEVTPPEADAASEAAPAQMAPEADTQADATAEVPVEATDAEGTPIEPSATDATPPADEPAAEAPAAEGEDALQDAMEAEATVDDTATPEAGDLEAAIEAEQPDAADPAPTAAPEAEAEAAPQPDADMTEVPAESEAVPEMTGEAADDTGTEAADAEAQSETGDLDAAMAAEQDASTDAETATEEPAAEEPAAADAAADSEAAATDTEATEEAPATEAASDETTAADAKAQPAAAEDAAKATQVPNVAALDDNATSEVTEEEVTEENSRSSSEDFATTMQEAASTEQQDAANDDSDDDNDLTKALLLGLGGVAVGAMLNNNRQVQLSTPDRVVVTRPDGTQELIKDDVALLRQPGSTVATENFEDGSSRTIVTREDGSRVVTIRDADLRILRRTLVSADGTQTALIDETATVDPVDIATLPQPAPAFENAGGDMDEGSLREALMREADIDRRFSLAQIRDISQVRSLVAPIDVNGITFDTNSAAINADQAKSLTALGNVIRSAIEENPNEIFLIEGHTDTVGEDAANLALSDRRAESVALALTEYFQVAPENMVVQGYGERSPKVAQEGDVRENRRVAVRRITGLLQTAAK
ncbi:OmpA family protein [Paracoccus indicus]|uniref:OmpA family protein n=1 Tax=Paracoccus indicus TaxID=2079229 RepID=UPI000D3CDCF6|nr:OmpA family protein [Paracoccus indicus]